MADAPYRDDRDADQARIASLEAELASAKDKIAELEGKRSQALVLAGSRDLAPSGKATTAAAKWFGAPMRLDLSRTWDKEFPVDKFEELIDLIRDHTRDHGRVELLKSSLMWSSSSPDKGIGPFLTIRVTVRGGTTKLEASDRLGQLAGVMFGAVGGGVGGGLIVLPIFGAIATAPVLAPIFIVGWLGAFFGGTRKLFKRSARKRAESLQQLFEIVEREIAARLV
ncbi:MAG TPA: hypothetical protein VLB44_06650 [Kofleriaceae bacterium]|nr:hypothetical protein [Kofleriaceae bacterium]